MRAPSSARSPRMSPSLWRTNSSGQRNSPVATAVSDRTTATPGAAPCNRPRSFSPSTSPMKPNVRAGAISSAKVSAVMSKLADCRPITGCFHSMVAVRSNPLLGATTYHASPARTSNGAMTLTTAGSPSRSATPARSIASNHGRNDPSRIGGSGPSRAMSRSSRRQACAAASRCSTVCTVAEPIASEVRRSVDSTWAVRAGMTGAPGEIGAPEDDARARLAGSEPDGGERAGVQAGPGHFRGARERPPRHPLAPSPWLPAYRRGRSGGRASATPRRNSRCGRAGYPETASPGADVHQHRRPAADPGRRRR